MGLQKKLTSACLGGAAWCMLVACGGGGGGGTTDAAVVPGESQTYVFSALDLPPASGSTAAGFNLDGENSPGSGTGCVERTRDYTSSTDPGETGVDNAMQALIPIIESTIEGDETLGAILSGQITSGDLLIIAEISDIHSYTDDSAVTVQLTLAEVEGCDEATPESCIPEVSGTTLAAGQTFAATTALGGPITGSIVAGRLRLSVPSLPLSVPVTIEEEEVIIALDIQDAQLRANISATALTNGAIGGSLDVDDLIETAMMLTDMEGIADVIRPLGDLEPTSDPTVCGSISIGTTFGAVDATLAD
jgi:hypothetical protein